MHFTSDLMLSHMGLAEAGLWARGINDDRDVALVISDTLTHALNEHTSTNANWSPAIVT